VDVWRTYSFGFAARSRSDEAFSASTSRLAARQPCAGSPRPETASRGITTIVVKENQQYALAEQVLALVASDQA
jgi:hypothetical protein